MAPSPISAAVRELQKLFARGNDIRTRYRIGQVIEGLKRSADGRGEEHAVRKLAATLGRDESTLYRFALVAEAWNEREFEILLERKNARGEALSFSHFVELAQVPDKAARRELLEYAMSYGASVRELIDAIAGIRSDEDAAADSLLFRVATMTDAARRRIETGKRLLAKIEQVDPKSTGMIARTLSSQRAILESSARTIEKLEAFTRSFHPGEPRDSIATGGGDITAIETQRGYPTMTTVNKALQAFSDDDLRRELVARLQADLSRRQEEIARLRALLEPGEAPLNGQAHEAPRSPRTKKTISKAPVEKPRAVKSKKAAVESEQGKSTIDYILDLLATSAPLKPRDIAEGIQKAGWTTTSENPGSMVGTYLKRLMKEKKVARAAKGYRLSAQAATAANGTATGRRGKKKGGKASSKTRQTESAPEAQERQIEEVKSRGAKSTYEFILELLGKSESLKSKDILDGIQNAGWKTAAKKPGAVVNTYLYQLVQQRKVEREDDGTYHLLN